MDKSGEETNAQIDGSTTDETIPIDLYLLWRTSEREKFDIQAAFDTEAKFDFQLVSRLSDGTNQDQNPCVYNLHLNLTKNTDVELTIRHKKKVYAVRQYMLRIFKKRMIRNTNYIETMVEFCNTHDSHYFLFNATFQGSSADGLVSFWKNLCLFTYYLIDTRQFNIFEIFIQQFQLYMHTKSMVLSKSDFISFIKTTFGYFSNKERILDHPIPLIDIVSMIGILPLEKNNFSVTDTYARKSSSFILKKVVNQLAVIFEQMNVNQWNFFNNGLAILMSIEILNNEVISIGCDSISLLHQIPTDTNQQKHLANTFFQELMKLRFPIERINWIELLSFVDEEKLNFDCLCLTTTFDHILGCLERIVPLHDLSDDMKNKLTTTFETKLTENIDITLNLHSIVKILQYLEKQPMATDANVEHLRLIQSVVESSIELRRRIMKCLNNLNIQITHLELLQALFRSYNPILLFGLDKTTFLINSLHGHEKRLCEFYTTWFECFLCDEHYAQTENELQQFQQLLNEWSKKFQHERDLLEKMTLKLNTLLEKLTAVIKPEANDRRLNYFIRHMIEIYFQQNPIYDVIAKTGPNLQNKMVVDAFVEKFVSDYINPNKYALKTITYYNNPLNRLIELYHRKSQATNTLLLRLLTRCADEIRPDKEELLRHSFLEPARDTCTYTILFNDCFAQFPIHHETLERLSDIWYGWENQQLTYEQIWKKKHYSPEQEQCFNKMWEAVGSHSGKQYQIAVLFDTAHKDVMEKTRTKEKITSCLHDYCDRAIDKQNYMDLLSTIQHHIERSVISEIRIPAELRQLVPLVERLIPFSHSNAWLQFYLKHVQEQGKTFNADEHWDGNPDDIDEDLGEVPNQIIAAVTTVDIQPPLVDVDATCMDILTRATKILDSFQRELQTISVQWNTIPIQQFLNLFPDIHSAETDIHILKPFIQAENVPNLFAILNFWKQRAYLQHICHGIKNLLNYLKLSLEESSSVVVNTLDDLLTIDEQTLGQICFDRYQRYLTTCGEKYSAQILNLWSQYYVSRDVIEFLHKLSATEMGNLLEAVNDWDDTLINTRTVMDFATLKTFFDQVYAMIDTIWKQEVLLTIDQIAICFEKVCQVEEFQRIVDLFPTCSTSLLAIQRLYLELTNKE